MRVSIHIITYNQASFLAEALDSALSQDWPDLEVVVGDDGSTDDTLALLADYQRRHGERLVVVTGPNVGITANSNRALRACTGDLIAFMGGDDVLLPGKLRAQAAWFAAHPDGVLCGHAVETFISDTGELLPDPSVNRRWGRGGRGPGALLEHGNLFAATAVMVRRSALPSYGFDERVPVVSDGKLWLDVLAGGGEWGAVPGVWARYRRHRKNVTQVWFDRCWTEAFIGRAIFEAEHPELVRECARGRAMLWYRRGVHQLAAGEVEEARRDLAAALRLEPTIGWRLPVWYAIARLPTPLRARALAAVARR